MKSNTPKIELKNLKTAEFASEETQCYEATVYVDGKAFCIASNQGHGGSDSYDAIRPRGGYKSARTSTRRSGESASASIRTLRRPTTRRSWRRSPSSSRTGIAI